MRYDNATDTDAKGGSITRNQERAQRASDPDKLLPSDSEGGIPAIPASSARRDSWYGLCLNTLSTFLTQYGRLSQANLSRDDLRSQARARRRTSAAPRASARRRVDHPCPRRQRSDVRRHACGGPLLRSSD